MSEEMQETVEFFVLEQTMVNGVNYILVADSEDDDGAVSDSERDSVRTSGDSAVYEIVEDDTELQAVSKVFEELLGRCGD